MKLDDLLEDLFASVHYTKGSMKISVGKIVNGQFGGIDFTLPINKKRQSISEDEGEAIDIDSLFENGDDLN